MNLEQKNNMPVVLDQQRIGFACKWVNPNTSLEKKKDEDTLVESYNQKGTTITWLNKQTKEASYKRLYDINRHNLLALSNQIRWLSNQPLALRMMRISSDFCTAYTHPDWKWVYEDTDMVKLLETNLNRIGSMARENNIRLSFHPGQFCVLNSVDDAKIDNAVEEFEYHTTLARYMGFGNEWHDSGFAINVHAGSREGGLDRLINTIENRLSPESRNLITIENDEVSHGLDSVLKITDKVAIVLDIHHHWCNTGGEYIQVDDPRVKQVVDSWRGVRPKFHLSLSKEDLAQPHTAPDELPDYKLLESKGNKLQKLRAHSDYVWSKPVANWCLTHLEWGDCMVEAKMKNLASRQLYDYWVEKNGES